MILDTSALVAILYREPEATRFAQAIHDADACRISVASYVEPNLNSAFGKGIVIQ